MKKSRSAREKFMNEIYCVRRRSKNYSESEAPRHFLSVCNGNVWCHLLFGGKKYSPLFFQLDGKQLFMIHSNQTGLIFSYCHRSKIGKLKNVTLLDVGLQGCSHDDKYLISI
jgi:hypothetical protein